MSSQSVAADRPTRGPQVTPPRRIGLRFASLLVVASMVGSGVFTTTGLLIRDLESVRAVLLVWLLGAVLAGSGALAYAELTAALPENGGEYALLSRIYHPSVGFVSGWISLVVGFSAPIAAAAVAFGSYLERIFPAVEPTVAAVILIGLLSSLHSAREELGSRIQDAATLLNVVLIALFIAFGSTRLSPSRLLVVEGPPLLSLMMSSKAALALAFVSFSYAGWNAPAYMAGEVLAPERTLPRAFAIGTSLVAVLYLGLNAVFLASAPASALRGVTEVGHVSAEHLFGPTAAPYVSGMIALGLTAAVGALTVTGPRVYERMGIDHPRLALLVSDRTRHGPRRAMAVQTALAIVLAASAKFDSLLTYVGFTLAITSGLTLAGVFVLRWREPTLHRPYRAWGHPITTGLALALMAWMVVLTLWERPLASVAGLLTLASGFGLYVALARRSSPVTR